MRKKAIFFSTDALIALMIIFLSVAVVYPVIKYSVHKQDTSSDIVKILSSLKIGEINNSYIKGLIANGEIKNLNNSILEQIGEFYALDIGKARTLANSVFSNLNTTENLGLWYGDDLIASINSSAYETAQNVEIERQTISGIEKGKASKGYVAKAWLKKILSKESSLFVRGDMICGAYTKYSWGDYCGSTTNNITYEINISNNSKIEDAIWLAEGSWINQYSKLYINNNKVFDGTINYYKILNVTSYLTPGKNQAVFYSTSGGDDGASHIVIDYSTPELQTFSQQKRFPFNIVKTKSILHYEKSIFIPTSISSMNVTINSSRDVTLSFRKGAKTILIGKKYPKNNTVFFSNGEISSNLTLNGISYSDLSNEYLFFILDIGKDNPGQDTILGGNSYTYISSAEIEIPYGSIDVNQEIPITKVDRNLQNTFYRYLVWTFYLPVNSVPVLADWQFGWLSLSGVSSQKASANSIVLYNSPPNDYIPAFSRFGYTQERAPGVFKTGENNFTLEFGDNYGVSNEASYGSLTYFIRSYVNYGDAKGKARGGTRTIQFEDGSTKQITIGNSSDAWDPQNDSIDDAVNRLLAQLDSDGDGKIDVIIDQTSLDIESLDVSGVPYIWSTEVQVRRWD